MKNTLSDYKSKKAFFDSLLTIYGRKPVLEALQDNSITFYKLHLANSNKPGAITQDIIRLAEQRNIDIQWHERKALSRISRNSKQDQGVAADLRIDQHRSADQFLASLHLRDGVKSTAYPSGSSDNRRNLQTHQDLSKTRCDNHAAAHLSERGRSLRILALCQIHNPQNLGMIIRSACAGDIDGILIPEKGCAALSPLVIKASAGTLFKAPVITCTGLKETLQAFKAAGFCICTLSSHATQSLFEYTPQGSVVYVLGNESDGVSADIAGLCDKQLMIPMNNNVESLNVAVTAALIAFNTLPDKG